MCIIEKQCRKCGKTFIPAPQHALKDSNGLYCSCTCFLHRNDGAKKPKPKVRKMVAQYTKGGEFIQTFKSAAKAAESLKGNPSGLSRACRNHTSYHGYIWKYIERTKEHESDCASETNGQSEKGS